MIAPSLCHIEYTISTEGERPSEHSVYVPYHDFEAKESDQTHFVLHIEPTLEESDSQIQTGLRIVITPKEPLLVTSCRVLFTGGFAAYDKALFNGYQSWTDTREVDMDSAQRGLIGTPKPIIERFVLDGAGDYRFHRYTNKPGNLHGWTYAYFTSEHDLWMVASLEETNGLTLLEWVAAEGLNVMPETPARELAVGEETLLADLFTIEISSPFEDCSQNEPKANALADIAMGIWLDKMGVAPHSDKLLTGYSSRYSHHDAISEHIILDDLANATAVFKTLDTTGFDCVFQIDEGYSLVGDWMSPPSEKFPCGLHFLASRIKEAGFIPGLWIAPFVCERASSLFNAHPDWLMRDKTGEAIRTGGHWSGGIALDTLNPEVRAYVTKCLRTIVETWGFKMLKVDFLYAACMVPHKGMNRGELMRDALNLIRDAVGDDAIIDACGVPLASAFGIVDFCRVGCNVSLDWDSPLYMRIAERERVSTKNSLFNTIYRAPLDRRAFGNDPDAILLRPDVKYTADQRDMVLYGAACHSSMLLTSDDVSTWTPENREKFQEALTLMRANHR